MNNEILEKELLKLFRDNSDQRTYYFRDNWDERTYYEEKVMSEGVFVRVVIKYLQDKEDSDTADQIFNSRFRNE